MNKTRNNENMMELKIALGLLAILLLSVLSIPSPNTIAETSQIQNNIIEVKKDIVFRMHKPDFAPPVESAQTVLVDRSVKSILEKVKPLPAESRYEAKTPSTSSGIRG